MCLVYGGQANRDIHAINIPRSLEKPINDRFAIFELARRFFEHQVSAESLYRRYELPTPGPGESPVLLTDFEKFKEVFEQEKKRGWNPLDFMPDNQDYFDDLPSVHRRLQLFYENFWPGEYQDLLKDKERAAEYLRSLVP